MGWTRVEAGGDALFDGWPGSEYCYFVHSYYPEPTSQVAIARATAGTTFPCALRSKNVVATQFHPEKSGPAGLRVLANWLREAETVA